MHINHLRLRVMVNIALRHLMGWEFGELMLANYIHLVPVVHIEHDDLGELPFNTIGSLSRACKLFGKLLGIVLEERY